MGKYKLKNDNDKYISGCYDRSKKCEIKLVLPIEIKEQIKKTVREKNISINKWLMSLVEKELI